MFKDIYDEKEIRKSGRFYTPTPFADYAHKYMESVFGENWKDEYVVWSCCCGTKNMTRDYYFKELYCSTLENAELHIGARYNKEATCFQMDFLNDDESKMPQGLINAMKENKPIIFFINPPYAQAGNGKTNGTHKEGCAKTLVNEVMLKDKMGACSQNLYAQFFYRIMMFKEKYNLTNLHIGLFCPTLFLSGSSYKNFRAKFLNEFRFNKAFLFNAGNFANCASTWGISFSIWNCGVTEDKENFIYDLVDFVDSDLEKIGEKDIYNIDGKETLGKWATSSIKKGKTNECVTAKSAINVSEKTKKVGDEIGYLVNDRNNVYASIQDVYFMTMPISRHLSVIDVKYDNFDKCTALFSARKIVEKDWMNAEDEFMCPNEEHPHYQEFVNDSLIYSLFTAFSQQSSLRNVCKKCDIKNEFFFMGKDEVMELANENHLDFTFNDASVSNDRYVYNKLQGLELSAEARAVLDKAIELTRASFKYRSIFNEEHPEYQIENWDCGWYQIKGMLKEFMPNELKEFNDLFKKLADKMRPMVYELGFLKK